MKTYHFLLILLTFILLGGCSKESVDKDDDDNNPKDTATSYVKFKISGPITNGEFEYKKTADNGFKSHGLIDYADESLKQPVLAGLTVYKSLTESFFSLYFPSKTGTHNLPFYDEKVGESYEIEFLFNREESYVGKDVEVKVSTLEFESFYIKKCKGTFSGEFNMEDQTGKNLGTHQITGEFEFNNN